MQTSKMGYVVCVFFLTWMAFSMAATNDTENGPYKPANETSVQLGISTTPSTANTPKIEPQPQSIATNSTITDPPTTPNTTTTPPPTPGPNTTTTTPPPPPTPDPNTTTTTPPPPPTPGPNTTTTPTPTPNSTTVTPPTPPTPITSTTTLVPPTTTTTTSAPVTSTPDPSKDRHFDGPSFIGGMVLTVGMSAIGFVAFKFYKARTERNYHTL